MKSPRSRTDRIRQFTKARDALDDVLWRLRGVAALAHCIHDDAVGTPFIDDLLPAHRAAVLTIVYELATQAEDLCDSMVIVPGSTPSTRAR